MNHKLISQSLSLLTAIAALMCAVVPSQAQDKKPNILFIMGGGYMNDFFAREFWRFVLVQQYVAKLAQTAINYPPMQAPASFNLEAIQKEIQQKIQEHQGQ